jgi:hypothetical protein
MIPHWDDSPYWARYLAQDANGDWYWFENEPIAHRSLGVWNCGPDAGRATWARKTPVKCPWSQTKQRYGKA